MHNFTIKDIISQDGSGLLVEQKIQIFEDLLRSTCREGIEQIIDFAKKTDFYTAPASSVFHSNYNGGLLDHSLIVYAIANELRNVYVNMNQSLGDKLNTDSIIISSLLHDVCKVCLYNKAEKFKKDDQGRWETYMGYVLNDTFPIGHGEKSVIMLQNFGLKMSADEMLAIRYHMGMWGEFSGGDIKASFYTAVNMCPLIPLIQIADYSASQLMENKQ